MNCVKWSFSQTIIPQLCIPSICFSLKSSTYDIYMTWLQRFLFFTYKKFQETLRLLNSILCAMLGSVIYSVSTETKFCTGRLRPEVQPLTLSYTILAEKVPLLYTFYWKKVPHVRGRWPRTHHITINLGQQDFLCHAVLTKPLVGCLNAPWKSFYVI